MDDPQKFTEAIRKLAPAAAQAVPTTNSTSITRLTTATTYQFRVAYCKSGCVLGDYTNPVTVTTL